MGLGRRGPQGQGPRLSRVFAALKDAQPYRVTGLGGIEEDMKSLRGGIRILFVHSPGSGVCPLFERRRYVRRYGHDVLGAALEITGKPPRFPLRIHGKAALGVRIAALQMLEPQRELSRCVACLTEGMFWVITSMSFAWSSSRLTLTACSASWSTRALRSRSAT